MSRRPAIDWDKQKRDYEKESVVLRGNLSKTEETIERAEKEVGKAREKLEDIKRTTPPSW